MPLIILLQIHFLLYISFFSLISTFPFLSLSFGNLFSQTLQNGRITRGGECKTSQDKWEAKGEREERYEGPWGQLSCKLATTYFNACKSLMIREVETILELSICEVLMRNNFPPFCLTAIRTVKQLPFFAMRFLKIGRTCVMGKGGWIVMNYTTGICQSAM